MTTTNTAPFEPQFDKRDQLTQVQYLLLPNEIIEAVFDLKGIGTGFIGITNKRIVFYDHAFLGRAKAIVSIPYSRIAAIAASNEGGLFANSKLIITVTGGHHEFEFRKADRAQMAHNWILNHMV